MSYDVHDFATDVIEHSYKILVNEEKNFLVHSFPP